MNVFTHDPDAKLDYSVDWSDWLATGETIASSTWVPSDADVLQLTDDTESSGIATAWVQMSDPVSGTRYRITNRITTSNGRIDDRTIILLAEDR